MLGLRNNVAMIQACKPHKHVNPMLNLLTTFRYPSIILRQKQGKSQQSYGAEGYLHVEVLEAHLHRLLSLEEENQWSVK